VLNYANRTSQPVQVYDNARSTQTATQYPATDIPAQLFANGEQGLWLDPSDFSTMFQNTSGSLPVTGVEQAVALMLDKSKGLVSGPELLINGDFSDGTTGWTLNGTNATLSVVNGALQIAKTSAAVSAYQAIAVQAGKTYRATVTGSIVSGSVTGGITFRAGPTFADSIVGQNTSLTSGTNVFLSAWFTATATGNTWLHLTNGITTPGTVEYDNVSVYEWPGNHVSASADARRPVLRARYNILTQTEAFDTTVWIKTNSTVVGAQPNAPNGTATATLFASNATNAEHFMFRSSLTNFIPITAGVRYTYAVHMKKGSGATAPDIMQLTFAQTQFETGNYANFNISAGQVLMTSGVSASISDAGSGWFLCTITATAIGSTTASGAGGIGFTDNNDSLGRLPSYADAATSDVFIWGADLRVAKDGVNIPNYQRVGAVTDYDTVGFPPYLAFDGVDDSLQTLSAVDFTSTDKVVVVGGLRKNANNDGVFVELSTNSSINNRSFVLFAPNLNNPNYFWRSSGTISASGSTANAYAAPLTSIMTGIGDVSNCISRLRYNGTEILNLPTDQGVGSFGNYTLFVGSRGNAGSRFNGRLYGLIVRGAYTAPRLVEQTEAYMNTKTQAY
jgi:hypothetical protein